MTYQVEANNGDEAWMCPRCGPSTPIVVRDSMATTGPRAGRMRIPRIRIPFVLVQLLIVSLTFLVFMGLLLNYMNRRYPVGPKRGSPLAVQNARPNAPLPRDPIVQQPGFVGDEDSSAGESVVTSAVAASIDSPEAAARPDASIATTINDSPIGSQLTDQHVGSVQNSDPRRLAASSGAENADATPVAEHTLEIDDLPLPMADDCLSIRDVQNSYPRRFGQEVLLQCRLIKVHDAAAGQVPHRFDIDGESFHLKGNDEVGFLRLEVRDTQGDTLQSVFARMDGPLGAELEWIMPGDWLLLTATPGVRYGQSSSEADWGLILIRVAALRENTHDRHEQATKKLAER
jgi:hypothetical protein